MALQSVHAQEAPAEVIIKMDPYVVAGERVLPPPEFWNYAYVPATQLERGKKIIQSPGYEVLSNLSEKNTKQFVQELQLRQFAGSMLWPMIAQTLPREPMVVILDRNKQAAGEATLAASLAWAGDPIAAPASNAGASGIDTNAFNTGMQTLDANMNEQSPSETLGLNDEAFPSEQPLKLATTRYQADMTAGATEPPAFTKTWEKPLPAGFTYVRAKHGVVAAQIHADEPLAGIERPTEEQLAADLSRRTAEFALFTFPEQPPRWFQSGLGWLIATTRVTPTRITFADTGGMLEGRKMPPLGELLVKNTALTFEEDLLSAAFTHWGLYGDNQKHAAKFMALVVQQCKGPVTEAQFVEIFGVSYKKMEMALSDYTHSLTNYTSRQMDGKLPEMPNVTVRVASQSEVARLQAESLVTEGKLDLALNGLRIAYWRGEREPAMLAILAGLEEKLGSLDRARKITQALLALPTPPARSLIVEARLRFRAALASKKPSDKLTAKETQNIMNPLGRALQAGQNTEDFWTFFSEIVMRSNGRPHESVTALLEQAARKFPKNTAIRDALTSAKIKPESAPAQEGAN